MITDYDENVYKKDAKDIINYIDNVINYLIYNFKTSLTVFFVFNKLW